MADILEQEALDAWDERKRKARVLGRGRRHETASSHGDDAGCGNGDYYDSCFSIFLWIKDGGGDIYEKPVGNSESPSRRRKDAVGVVEIILILVVLIGLVIIFKEQLTSLVRNILSKITKQSNSI